VRSRARGDEVLRGFAAEAGTRPPSCRKGRRSGSRGVGD
jgi:hypothetical protein